MIITLNTGIRITTEVAANRRSYPAWISAELTVLQRQYAPAQDGTLAPTRSPRPSPSGFTP